MKITYLGIELIYLICYTEWAFDILRKDERGKSMDVKWNISNLIGRCRDKTGKILTYDMIHEGTGIDRMTVSKMVLNKAVSAKLRHIAALMEFFSLEIGEPIRISDVFAIVEDKTEDKK